MTNRTTAPKKMTLESRDPNNASEWMRQFQPWGSSYLPATLAADEAWLAERYGSENVRWVEAH